MISSSIKKHLIIREQYSRLTILAFLASFCTHGWLDEWPNQSGTRPLYGSGRTGRMGFLLVKRAHRRVSVVSACGFAVVDGCCLLLLSFFPPFFFELCPASLIFNPSFTIFFICDCASAAVKWNRALLKGE